MVRRLLFIIISAMIVSACSSEKNIIDKTTESITSSSWNGKAKIISIGKRGESSSLEKDYFEVRFDFIPDDTGAPGRYLVKDVTDKNILLYYDNRNDLHVNWISRWGLKTGNVYRAVRHENILNRKNKMVSFEVLLEPR